MPREAPVTMAIWAFVVVFMMRFLVGSGSVSE
jgi:hypothetical protein